MTYIPLGYGDLALAALLVGVNAVLSLVYQLGLGSRLAFAAGRMVVQLLLVGLVLEALFRATSPLLTLAVVLVMVAFAGHEVSARQTRPFSGWWTRGIGAGSMMIAGITVTVIALTTQIRPDPWYDPRYAIPLLGMVLGNAMSGVSIGLERLLSTAARERATIEARLALGQTFPEAISTLRRDAVRSGLIPTINAMSAAGVVFLPGMMTGQILAGVEPAQAVKYQILVMFLIAGGTGLGVVTATVIAARRLSDDRHRLRLDRLTAERET